MTDSTLTLGTSTTLDYFDFDEECITTVASTVSATLSTASPINNYHYHCYYADRYIESLSNEEIASIQTLLDSKEIELENTKKLVKVRQS